MIRRNRWPLLVAGERVILDGKPLLQGQDIDMGPAGELSWGRVSARSAVRVTDAVPLKRASLRGLADYGKGAMTR